MTSSNFDKMLSQYQGNLPNISDTNYSSELDYTLTEEVNKEIDNLKNDFARRTDEAVNMAERAADRKKKDLESLVGLIGSGKKLYDYWKAKDLAIAQYDQVHKTNLETAKILSNSEVKTEAESRAGGEPEWYGMDANDYVYRKFTSDHWNELNDRGLIGKKIIDGKEELYIKEKGFEYIDAKLRLKDAKWDLQNKKLINQHEKELFEARSDQLDIQQRLNLVKKNRATADELTARELQWQIAEDFDAIFPSLLRVKKQLPGMDTPMSYMDATSKDATAEDAAFAAVLLRDALADYSAFNQDYIDKIGEKRYREEVFPELYKQAQVTHKKFMDVALANARSDNRDANAKAFAATFKREGINAMVGSGGSVSIYERTLDGGKDNGMGFAKSANLLTHAVDQGYLSGRELQDAINTPFRARGGGTTTLEELKPEVYNQLRIVAQNDINEELKREKSEMASDILQQTANIQDQAKEQNWSTDEIKAQAGKTWSELAKKHGLSPANPAFAELISLANYGQTRADRSGDALLELQGQELRGELLSSDLIARLEPELQQAWKDKAKILGSEGLTSQELQDADAEFVQIIKDYKEHGTIDQRLGPTMRLARTRMLNFYNATYQELMRADNREDTLAAKEDNKKKAMKAVKDKFNTIITAKDPAERDKDIFGPPAKLNYEQQVSNEKQLVQYLGVTEKPADVALYWNSLEEEAIINSLAAEEKGEPISGWWTDKAKYFPNMTGRELFKRRAEATADLREGEVGDIKIEDKYGHRLIAVKQNAAKTGQHFIEPKNTENMLTELQVQDADYSSTFRLPETIQEFDPSQMTLRELLQLRVDNYGPWNDDIGLGIYDMQMKELVEMLKIPGVLEELGGGDAVFDEKMQKKLMGIKLLHKANQSGSMKSLDNSYRKINHITDEEQVAYNGIVSGAYGEELANDPFRQLNTLTSEVAKVALEDVMAYA